MIPDEYPVPPPLDDPHSLAVLGLMCPVFVFWEVCKLLKEDVIKHQWRCKATPFWLKKSIEYNFLLLMHEHLFIFRKPAKGENLKESTILE